MALPARSWPRPLGSHAVVASLARGLGLTAGSRLWPPPPKPLAPKPGARAPRGGRGAANCSPARPGGGGELQPRLIQSIRGVMSYESADSIKGDCDGRQSPGVADGERSPLPSERVHLCRRVPSLCSLKGMEAHKGGRSPRQERGSGARRASAHFPGGETEARRGAGSGFGRRGKVWRSLDAASEPVGGGCVFYF